MNKGVSLISLIITIIVIIILAGVATYNSLTTVEQSQVVKLKKEFNDVCTYVTSISSHAEAGNIDLNNLTEDTLATIEQLAIFSPNGEFTAEEQNNIKSLNESRIDTPKYGYHYITGKQIESGIPGLEEHPSNLDNIENNYIINFYYGTVVAKVSNDETCINGKVR